MTVDHAWNQSLAGGVDYLVKLLLRPRFWLHPGEPTVFNNNVVSEERLASRSIYYESVLD